MSKWKDHRVAVKETLKRRGKTAYWLAEQLEGAVTVQHLYAYIRGETGISVDVQSKINEALGLRYTDE
jgi:plasmid maintenance system antidote protein VapI